MKIMQIILLCFVLLGSLNAKTKKNYTVDELSRKLCYAELIEYMNGSGNFVRVPAGGISLQVGTPIRTTVGVMYENSDPDIVGATADVRYLNYNIAYDSPRESHNVGGGATPLGTDRSVWSGYPAFSNPGFQPGYEGMVNDLDTYENAFYHKAGLSGNPYNSMRMGFLGNRIFYKEHYDKLNYVWKPNEYSVAANFYLDYRKAKGTYFSNPNGVYPSLSHAGWNMQSDKINLVTYSGKLRKCRNAPSYNITPTWGNIPSGYIQYINAVGYMVYDNEGYFRVTNINYNPYNPSANPDQKLYTIVAGNNKFKNRFRIVHFDKYGNPSNYNGPIYVRVGSRYIDGDMNSNSANTIYDASGNLIQENTPINFNGVHMDILLDTSNLPMLPQGYTFVIAKPGTKSQYASANSDTFIIRPSGVKMKIGFNRSGYVKSRPTAGVPVGNFDNYGYYSMPYNEFRAIPVGVDGKEVRGYYFSTDKVRFDVKSHAPAGCFSNPVTLARMNYLENIKIRMSIGIRKSHNGHTDTIFSMSYYDPDNPSSFTGDAFAPYDDAAEGLIYPEVGKVSLRLDRVIDDQFTLPDRAKGGCIPGSTSNEPDASGRVGCDIAIEFNEEIGNHRPYAIMPTGVKIFNFQGEAVGSSPDMTYLSNDPKMSASISYGLQAVAYSRRTAMLGASYHGWLNFDAVSNSFFQTYDKDTAKDIDQLIDYTSNKNYITQLFTKDCYAEDLNTRIIINRKNEPQTFYGEGGYISRGVYHGDFTANDEDRTSRYPKSEDMVFFADPDAKDVTKDNPLNIDDSSYTISQKAFVNGVVPVSAPIAKLGDKKEGVWMKFNFKRDNRYARNPFDIDTDLLFISGENKQKEYNIIGNQNIPSYFQTPTDRSRVLKFYYGRAFLPNGEYYNTKSFEHLAYYTIYCKDCDATKYNIDKINTPITGENYWYTTKKHDSAVLGEIKGYNSLNSVLPSATYPNNPLNITFRSVNYFEDSLKATSPRIIVGTEKVEVLADSWLIYSTNPLATSMVSTINFYLSNEWGGQLFDNKGKNSQRIVPVDNALEQNNGSMTIQRPSRRLQW